MATVTYSPDSLYANTQFSGNYLDILTYRNIPAKKDDVLFTLTNIYEYRPDLLAHDLYKNANLWWVFAVRNPNQFKDPIFDFVTGIQFYLPKQTTIQSVLGL